MMRVLVVCLLLSLGLLGQTSSSAAGKTAADSPKFAALCDSFIKESLALSPVSASGAGYHQHRDSRTGKTIELDAQLDDLSPQAFAEQRAFYQRWRARFKKETPPASLSPEDAADWQLIDDQIGLSLLELDTIQSYKHNPTGYVELIGNGLFLPLTQDYAPREARLGHVLSRIGQIPRVLQQARRELVDSDPIFVKVALEENEGNIGLIEETVPAQIPAGSPLQAEYDKVGPAAVVAIKDFDEWLQNTLAKRPTTRTWRLGKDWYAQKFRLVMETDITPEQVLADAEQQMREVRARMLELALPMHHQMFPAHGDHSDLQGRERENAIISEVLHKISDDHCERDKLVQCAQDDLAGITAFIREKKIVALSGRSNLKVIPTPAFMRGAYGVGGFHSAPPLEPTAEAEYWVTPIDPKASQAFADSRLREYNTWVLQWLTIHEALPGHYIQAEHANDIQPVTRRLVRGLFSNGPYVEGWAEYMAQVMLKEGYANRDPRYELSYWKVWLRAVANVVLDVRLQTMDMTDQQALDMMEKDCFQTQAEAEGKLQRAKLSSTQLPTYFVGTREWWSLREKYQQQAGKDFNMMDFHNRALAEGALPVPVMEKILLASPQK
jgi:uncharacterized protein (DUF885 family)